MGILKKSNLTAQSKQFGLRNNVCLQTIDVNTKQVVQKHYGHNAATNGLLVGIGHYLTGDGILNQGWHMLSKYVPQYISLGTMGLINQNMDENGLPDGIGVFQGTDEETRFTDYMNQVPGYGADGYDANENNNREYFGLGPMYSERESEDCINCELITSAYMRESISYRDIVPETEAEIAKTIDVVFSCMVPLNALNKFRGDNEYLFVTEAGLWSRWDWNGSGDNGLLAGYRIAPPNEENWDMTVAENREILKQNILCVGANQVVQVIWKIQLGALEQLLSL